MTVYVVAELTIHDRDRYDRYAARFPATLRGFDGRLLAADEAPIVVEGTWDHEKLVLIEFREDEDDLVMNEFISLSEGMEYIRWTEVVGMRWKRYMTVDEEYAVRLEVYFSEAPASHFYGDDARSIMRFFDLPEEPPPEKAVQWRNG